MHDEYTLLCPVFSYLKPANIYGKVGDKVKVIKRLGTCLIVENEKGERFPINEKKLTAAKVAVKPEPHPVHKHQPQKKEKSFVSNQKNLF